MHRSHRARFGFVLLAVAVLGQKACVFREDPVAVQTTLDVPLGPGEVRGGVITQASELLPGLTARGRVGDFKLYNDRIGVVIAAAGSSRGYHPYGGVLLDADRMTPTGPAGHSAFGEVIAALDLVVLRADAVEVVADGRDGEAAVVRVTGGSDVMPLFDALLSGLFTPRAYDLEWTLDYVLEPGADHLRLDYRVKNLERETADFGLRISAFMFGDGADPFVQGHGFDVPGGGVTAPYYGAIGEDVSYLYGAADTNLNLLVTEAGVVVTGHGDGFDVIARDVFSYSHILVIGDGDLSNTQELWRKAVAAEASDLVTGEVVDAAGRPVVGARVHAAFDDRGDTDYASYTVTDEAGAFSLRLDPGAYRIVASTDAGLVSASELMTTGGPQTVRLEVPVPGGVRYSVKDDAGTQLPVKISVQRDSEALESLPARYGVTRGNRNLFAIEFAHTGEGTLALPAGDYTLTFSRGNEYEVEARTVTVTEDMTTDVEVTLARSVDTPGWMSTDTHIHAQLSPDSPDLYPFKVRTMVVEGLELPISTEHEAIGDFNPAIRELGLERWMQGVTGSEVTTFTYGHFNAYPMTPDFSRPGNGRVDWYGLKPADTFAAIRENPAEPFIQVNHPRSPSIGGYFSAMGLAQDSGAVERTEQWSPDFDGIEVLNGCGNGTIEQQPIRDWFGFLNRGVRKVGTASTDNHRASGGDMGYPRTYVRMPTDDPVEAKVEDLAAAFFGGRLTLSCGPFVTMRAGAAEIGDIVAAADGGVDIEVHVAAPSWMDVDVVEVIVGGVVVETYDVPESTGTVRFEDELRVNVPAGQDTWIAVSVRGDRRHGAFASNRPSFALTNPLFVDGDGDGAW
ncbi:MAG: CehA/McbA family metallohydrolase [Deltaproteobacteria bacterium]|jgi:hypothetical protein